MTQYIYMTRHGQTVFNLAKKIQGACDSPLTDWGIKQAEVARDYFQAEGIYFDAAYSSTQERASHTLEIMLGEERPYTRLKGLKEWDFGAFEGESEKLNPPLPYEDFFVAYGGESQDQVMARLNRTMHDLMAEEKGKQILVVSHGAAIINFMRSVVAEAEWKSGHELGFTNCSSLLFEYDEGNFTFIKSINHDFHNLIKGDPHD